MVTCIAHVYHQLYNSGRRYSTVSLDECGCSNMRYSPILRRRVQSLPGSLSEKKQFKWKSMPELSLQNKQFPDISVENIFNVKKFSSDMSIDENYVNITDEKMCTDEAADDFSDDNSDKNITVITEDNPHIVNESESCSSVFSIIETDLQTRSCQDKQENCEDDDQGGSKYGLPNVDNNTQQLDTIRQDRIGISNNDPSETSLHNLGSHNKNDSRQTMKNNDRVTESSELEKTGNSGPIENHNQMKRNENKLKIPKFLKKSVRKRKT